MAGSAPTPRAGRWWPLLLVMAVAVVVVGIARHPRAPLVARPLPAPVSSATVTPSPTTGTTPTVTTVEHPMLGITQRWDLFARGVDDLIRIQFATGRVTFTPYPGLGSSGPVTLLAARRSAIIRPIDFVPGYQVPDQGPAEALTGAFSRGGLVIPGADADHFWVQNQYDSGASIMMLTNAEGTPLGPQLAVPDGISALSALPDGRGNVLFSTDTGTYLGVRQGLPPHLINKSPVFAVGPTHFLLRNCDLPPRCSLEVLDRRTGLLRTLVAATRIELFNGPGLISPDGRTAAVVATTGADPFTPSLWLIDLRSGASRAVRVPVDTHPAVNGSMIWSPDSRLLFAVTDDRRIAVVLSASATARSLGTTLPPVTQVALRPTG